MKVRFQADNDLNEHIVRAVKRLDAAIDFQTAPAAGLHEGIPDDQVLVFAASEGHILVSHDKKTMPDHFGRFIAGQISPGLFIVSRKLSIGQAAEWLHLFWSVTQAEEHINQITYLP